MQVHFETDYLRMLFSDPYFKDDIGVKAVQNYQIAVNYIMSANSLDDLKQARFLKLKPVSGSEYHSIPVGTKYELFIGFNSNQVFLIRIQPKEN